MLQLRLLYIRSRASNEEAFLLGCQGIRLLSKHELHTNGHSIVKRRDFLTSIPLLYVNVVIVNGIVRDLTSPVVHLLDGLFQDTLGNNLLLSKSPVR